MTRATLDPNRIPFLTMLTMMLLTASQFPFRAHAGENTAKQRALTIDCQRRYISQRDAGWLMGSDNFGQTYARRIQLYTEVARACATGVAAVRVEMPASTRSTSTLAQR